MDIKIIASQVEVLQYS